MEPLIVIGLTGSFGSGCSAVAKLMAEQYRFKPYSLSGILRQLAEADSKGPYLAKLTPDQRKELQDYGDSLREKNGSDYLAKKCSRAIWKDVDAGAGATHFVIDSIRNPGEVQFFRSTFTNFFLVSVYASKEERWVRIGKDSSWNNKEFDARDERDKGEDDPGFRQGVQRCVDQADVFITNETHCRAPGEWEANLWFKVDDLVGLVMNPGGRIPDEDELYMGQAYAASLRSTCCKRKVGAVIAREHTGHSFLVSTGWNHVPAGLPSCEELGGTKDPKYCVKDEAITEVLRERVAFCPACGSELHVPPDAKTSFPCPHCEKVVSKIYSAGRQLDLCPAVHAEEAAILQASELGGTSLHGTTLYTTTFPCLLCAKMIAQIGIREIVFAETYPMPQAVQLLQDAGKQLRRFEGVSARAYFRLFKVD